jgi:type II secretory pathway pseudopilin PulG
VELLVVIGIIIVLMGILFPVISRIRRAAQVADTQNEISQIANACNAYYTTFNAYPGPLSNDQIESINNPKTPTFFVGLINPNNRSAGPAWKAQQVTGAENLVLGLMGGLSGVGTSPSGSSPIFDPTLVGLGAKNLNSVPGSFGGQTPAFFPNGSTYLMWCEQTNGGQPFQTTTYQTNDPGGNSLSPTFFTDQAGTRATDSFIPVFVDRFPTPGPLPILYLRARTGAKGVVSFLSASNYGQTPPQDPTTNSAAQYQYDLGDIVAYTAPNAAGRCIGLPTGKAHNLNALETVTWLPASVAKSAVTNIPDAFGYFANQAIPPTDTTVNINYTGRPRAVDQFMLISAGPDGIYGTADDITSFGDVSQ